ncbi:hypothetical protein N7462_011445 [Penicillium macrosclerotiorum]|uniref:uncharacterized protein n=1 Tax=Penicillium macrosclerotiorum TaxID=303699 RepID=UPI002546603D|nr:uncharacterized protein N7462_011445 [Penicillium macrosclerotiorum]KAJ5664632.1 hypothetical protein N7462_011445 [Penicillium macrosclerotiorum]
MTDTTAKEFKDPVKKLTLSCSRCRASKLKCDRKEPCLECIKRDCAHLCTKDERRPRAKRTKVQHQEQNPNQTTSEDTEVEDTAQVLEHFVDDVPLPSFNASTIASDFPNHYWVTPDPHRHEQKLALIREIMHALPDWELVGVLYEVFITRCQGPLGNVRPLPETAIASTLSMDQLAGLLLALVLGLAFHPTPSLLGWTSIPATLRVEQMRASDESVWTWRSLAVRCLQGRISLFCGSIHSLQAAIMLLLDARESWLELDAVLATAISGAHRLGLHRLGNAPLGPDPRSVAGQSLVRTEIGIRIWWALVMRDWSRGQTLGYYTLLPSHFNTRTPLHLNDDDLLRPHAMILERPRSEFTMLSYTVHALELVNLVRESLNLGDEKGEQRRKSLFQKYEQYVAGLPSFFRLGSTMGLTAMGPMAAIPVQRFMLHQQLWSFLLRLHRGNLSSHMGRASCQLLAQNIISTQAQIQARVVLILGLLFDAASADVDHASAQLARLMTRDKIRESIELLRSKNNPKTLEDPLSGGPAQGSGQRSVAVLEALMKLEEGGPSRASGAASESESGLHRRVLDILKRLDAPVTGDLLPPLSMPEDTFMTLPVTMADEFPDMDVIPMLSHDLGPNMWDFLDFSLHADGPSKGQLPIPSGQQPLSRPSDPNTLHQSLSSSAGTQTLMIQTSPSSLESAPTLNPATTPSNDDTHLFNPFEDSEIL